MTNKLNHHHLTAELVNDEHGEAIVLTQQKDRHSEPSTVMVHPWQIRAVCEQFGILSSDPQAAKNIATLQRRMRSLFERIDKLDDWLTNHSDHRNADLSQELASIGALYDLAREWCADFDSEQAGPAVESDSTPAECTSAPAAQAALL